jgi:hypothetical protein
MYEVTVTVNKKVPLTSKFGMRWKRPSLYWLCASAFSLLNRGLLSFLATGKLCGIFTKNFITTVRITANGSIDRKVMCHPKLCVMLPPPTISPNTPPKRKH